MRLAAKKIGCLARSGENRLEVKWMALGLPAGADPFLGQVSAMGRPHSCRSVILCHLGARLRLAAQLAKRIRRKTRDHILHAIELRHAIVLRCLGLCSEKWIMPRS